MKTSDSRDERRKSVTAHPDQPSRAQVELATTAFRMLSDPTRVAVLWSLRDGELDVSALAEAAGATPNAVSQHLAKLRLAGLVEARRDGRHSVYRLRGSHVRRLLAEALSHADHQLTGAPIHD